MTLITPEKLWKKSRKEVMSRYQTSSLFETEDAQQGKCSHIIRVAFESAADMEFDYLVPDELWPIEAGQRVEAPFGRNNKLEKVKFSCSR